MKLNQKRQKITISQAVNLRKLRACQLMSLYHTATILQNITLILQYYILLCTHTVFFMLLCRLQIIDSLSLSGSTMETGL